MSSISSNSLILQDPKEFQSPIGRRPYYSCLGYLDTNLNSANNLHQDRSPYFTRSVAKRNAALHTSDSSLSNSSQAATNSYSVAREISLTSLSFNQVNVSRRCITPNISLPSSTNYNLIRRLVPSNLNSVFSNYNKLERHSRDRNSSCRRSRNPSSGYVSLRGPQMPPFPQPNDTIDFPGGPCGGGGFPWCKILSFLILTAILMPTVWYIHGHFCATQTFFNKVEEDLCKLREQVERMKNNVETGTNQQLENIGKDTSQKLAEVEQILRNIKSCPQSDSSSTEMDCCATFDSPDDGHSGIGRPDFALESSGGSILGIGDTEQFEPGSSSASVFGIPICCSRNGPRAVIQANVQPGECWAFKGYSGSVTIKLLGHVYLSGVSLEHIPKSISPSGDIDSAPNEFSIVGLKSESETEGKVYGRFSYKNSGQPVQFFPIDGCSESYEVVQLVIHSNHGNPRFTCVYRLQVHGKLDEDETRKLEGH